MLDLGADNSFDTRLEAVRQLQQLAKERGLWALGHPKEIGGQGMAFRDYIYANEAAYTAPPSLTDCPGRCRAGPS